MDIKTLREDIQVEMELIDDRREFLSRMLKEIDRRVDLEWDNKERAYTEDEREGKIIDNVPLKSDELCSRCIFDIDDDECCQRKCRDCENYTKWGCYCTTVSADEPCRRFIPKED